MYEVEVSLHKQKELMNKKYGIMKVTIWETFNYACATHSH